MILAGIDIGTNTVRLLVADAGGSGGFREISSGRIITRLGEGLDRAAFLSPEACARSLAAIAEFTSQARLQKASMISAIGTSALRNASNRAEFIRSVLEATGVAVQVISGREEARLTVRGVLAAIRGQHEHVLQGAAAVIDIGGGSTEVIHIEEGRTVREASLPLGAVYLTERHIHHDPPEAPEIDAVRSAVRAELDKVQGPPGSRFPGALVGTAGTITTLAAMDQELVQYDPDRINGYVLGRTAVDGLIRSLSTLTLAERRRIKGLEQGREDIVLAGALVLEGIMDRMGASSLVVSDWGLREGIIFDMAESIPAEKGASGSLPGGGAVSR